MTWILHLGQSIRGRPPTWLALELAVVDAIFAQQMGRVKALVWFWLIDETLSANLVYQGDYEIGSTTPSDEAITKIMTMVMAW